MSIPPPPPHEEYSAWIFNGQAALWDEKSLRGSVFRVKKRQVDVNAVIVGFCSIVSYITVAV